MVLIDECIKVGDHYYDAEDFKKKLLDSRIQPIIPEDLI